MTILASMPGRWPNHSREEVTVADEPSPTPSSQLPRTPQQEVQIGMDQLSTNDRNELFFSMEQNSEATSPSYLLFEPVVSSVAENEPIDWRRYDPPEELLKFQDDTSEDLRNLLAPSIERLQARHAEEIETREATARPERPLTRGRRVSVKPQINTPNGNLDPSFSTNRSRLSDASNLSVSSFDSGYASRSPEIGSTLGSRSSARSSFGFGSIFNFSRRDRRRVESDDTENFGSHPAQPESPSLAPVGETTASPSRTGECVSCLDDFPTSDLIKLSCHGYCPDCFQRLISNALESETHWPAKCCLNTIPSSTILPHLDSQTKKKYSQREAEWSIPAGDRIYCAQPSCSAWIPAKNVNNQLHSAKCPKCAQKACTICRGEFHNGNDCPQDPNLQATINLAEMEGWKRCYSCQALVEHNKGCRHMTCRCKAQFCYICGLRWRTCGCTDTQLVEIQQQATTRRHEETARTAREAAEAEEVRIAVQQVADFERAEAEREAREAEARRRIEEERRRRREEEHIAAVNLRFHQLTNELDLLHDVQRVLIAERYEFEQEGLNRDRNDALDTLSMRHPQEVQFLGTESRAKIADAEHKFDMEYQTRLAEERRIEDNYVDELRDYWKGKPESEYKVREARDELRRDQDKEYRFWDAYRRKQLQAISDGERRKMDALLAKQQSEIKALDGRSKIDEVEWKRKKWAEGKWVEEVTRERVVMLQAQEQEEYAREE